MLKNTFRLPSSGKVGSVVFLLFSVAALFMPKNALSGPYADSIHGDSSAGVYRTATIALGYARGNCAHCHEQHASAVGSEPAPVGGSASPFALMADTFSGDTSNPYSQSDNFCFFCHITGGGVQSGGSITNLQYSDTFGCASSSDANGVMEAFNLHSYHNLYDVWKFASDTYSSFTIGSNPCDACHNPHRVKQNRADPDNPAESVLSKPSDHENLVTTTMDDTYNGFSQEYEPPYCGSPADREPDGSASAVAGAENTPDYVEFCTDCHTSTNIIYSNNLTRFLIKIDWSATGDKHGMLDRDVEAGITYRPLFVKQPERLPYVVTFVDDGGGNMAVTSHNVLSCMDCHEPHGSANVTLIRDRVNSEALTADITSSATYNPSYDINVHDNTMGYLCQKCHKDDYQLGGTVDQTNEWRTVHHQTDEAPYPSPGDCDGTCGVCHGFGGTQPITCSYCHFHGSGDSWMSTICPTFTTSRDTF